MDTMYKLTKQIDALTYNSRAVLNALVRSCIAAGSSNGYTVKRFGVELTLDRTDIFRLYDFYQSWANGTYGYAAYTSEQDEFADILAKCDAKWKGDYLVTKALVTHSKILYLVSTNRDNESDSYWIGLVRDSSSPKLVTNSAPIPLNLRTPLYDADLSTKSFSQYETYLFPSGYSKISITGMPGDSEDHVGGGKSWLWDIDESIDITAPRITLGHHTNTKRRLENYKDTKYSMSFGDDSYALGERSVSLGGLYNIAYGRDSATLGGNNNYAIAPRSGVLCGYINTTVGDSAIGSGYGVNAIAPFSMAGNISTVSGAYAYDFTIEGPTTTVNVVECEAVKDTVSGKCFTTEGSTTVLTGDGRNTIRIAYSSLVANGFWRVDIEKGDKIVIFSQTRTSGTHTYDPTVKEGYAFKPLYFVVANITRDNGDYLIQLNGSIPNGETMESLTVNGGKVARYEVDYREIAYDGRMINTVKAFPGRGSNALNYNTYATGMNQTVVGQMNRGNTDAKFIVGVGSSYIGNTAFRRNGLVVAQGYSYMQTSYCAAAIGVSDVGTQGYRDYDAKFTANGAWMHHSSDQTFNATVIAHDERTTIGLSDSEGSQDNNLTFVRSGSGYISSDYDVSVRLESMAGTVIISAGSYVGAKHLYDVLLPQSSLRHSTGNAIALFAEDGIELRSTNPDRAMVFHNSGYISATFKGLWLNGETWGALAADSNARSYWVYHNSANVYNDIYNTPGHCVDFVNTIAHSGFFYGQNDWHPGEQPYYGRVNLPVKVSGTWEEHQGRGFHIINSAVSYVNQSGESGYDISCLVLPGQVTRDEIGNPPHPKVISSFIYGTGNNGVNPKETYVTEELAYMRDVQRAKPTSYVSAITADTITKVFFRDLGETTLVNTYSPPVYDMDDVPYVAGNIVAGTVTDMTGYFNRHEWGSGSRFAIEGRPNDEERASIPTLLASDDYCVGITFRRYGPIVAANILLRMESTKYSEFLVISSTKPAINLGIGGSLVMTGTGLGGISVSCTISTTLSQNYRILGKTYNSDYMYDFLIKNPSGISRMMVPITLVGTIN